MSYNHGKKLLKIKNKIDDIKKEKIMSVLELSKKDHDYVVGVRRYLHQNPELSMEEKETSAYLQKALKELGVPFEIVPPYGILAKVEGKNKDKMVALRGDMDALPIQEENPHLDYQSTVPKVMHACGHDAHTAMLLGAVRVLNQMKSQLNGTVLFCFQQAEEMALGAKLQVEALKAYPVKGCFGMHVSSNIEAGVTAVSPGGAMAAIDIFKVKVQGKGGHGARPDLAVDPILACASMVLGLSRAKAQEMNPFEASTISVGGLQAGDRYNVVPDTGYFEGTIRTLSDESRKRASDIVNRVCKGIAMAHNVEVEVEIRDATQVLYNDPSCVELYKKSALKILPENMVRPCDVALGSEDFSEFSSRYPSVFARLGTMNKELGTDRPHHHPKFNLDDSVLSTGVALYAQYAVDFLEQA